MSDEPQSASDERQSTSAAESWEKRAVMQRPALTTDVAASGHERDEYRAIVASILIFWAVHWGILTVRSLIAFPADALDLGVRRAPLTLLGMALSYVVYMCLRPLRGAPFGRRVVIAGLLVIPAAMLYGAGLDWLFYYGPDPYPIDRLKPYDGKAFVMNGIPWLGSFFSWAAILLAIGYSADARERELRLAQVQALAHSAQLRALRYQINPHFLFNTLNSISSLIWEKDFERAEAMLVNLSGFLRASLEADPTEDVTLEQEIELQRLYLQIEQIRFDKRLRVDIDMDPALARAQVPSLILQPLVENAIKYGVGPSKRATRVRITARREADDLLLEVTDDGAGSSAPAQGGTGLGLENVRQRLKTRFGDRGRFTASYEGATGFRVALAMPFRTV